MKFCSRHSFLLIVITMIFINMCIPIANAEQNKSLVIDNQLSDMENLMNARIGLFAINTANRQQIQYRSLERFSIQSTFKVMAVCAILKRSMIDKDLLQQNIMYTEKDLVTWSPITEKHLTHGMTIFDLCSATLMYSDNTAANLIMQNLGGINAVNSFARSIQDNTFRIDNWEDKLNSDPNDLHDTSTPSAMTKACKNSYLEMS